MELLLFFAFLAGIVTVLSPCILPVLPIVLSGGMGGGKSRPLGVISGFVLSFTTVTLALSALVQNLGLDPDVLRLVAAGFILSFGLVLLIPRLKQGFMAGAERLVSLTGRKAPSKRGGGYWSGLTLGLGLGFVWTPCVGPIMAGVATLAMTQQVNLSSVFITLSYSLGTAVPLFLIMLGGRGLLQRFPWFTKHSEAVQRGFGVLMIVTALAILLGGDRAFSSWFLQTFPGYGEAITFVERLANPKSVLE